MRSRVFACVAAAVSVAAHNPHDTIMGMHVLNDNATVLAISRGILYRSSDGKGRSFEVAHNGLPTPFRERITFASFASGTGKDSDVVYLLSLAAPQKLNGETGLWRSTDGGKHWTGLYDLVDELEFYDIMAMPEALGGIAQRIAVSSEDASTVVLALDTLRVSTDGGKTFKEALKVDDTSSASVSLRRSGSSPAEDSIMLTKFFSCVASVPGSKGMLAGTSTGDVHASADGGLTWKSIVHGGSNGKPITSLQAMPAAHGRVSVLVGSTSEVRKLDYDAKAPSLKDVNHELSNSDVIPDSMTADQAKGHVVATAIGDAILVASDHTMFRTTDAGKNWFLVGPNAGYWTDMATISQADDERAPMTLRMQVANGTLFAGTFNGIFTSTDEGTSWVKVDTINPYITAVYAPPGGNVSACTYAIGCFTGSVADAEHGNTAGARYEIQDVRTSAMRKASCDDMDCVGTGLVTTRYVILAYSPEYEKDGVVIAGSSMAGLTRSTDRGTTWKLTNVDIGSPAAQLGDASSLSATEFSPDGVTSGAGGAAAAAAQANTAYVPHTIKFVDAKRAYASGTSMGLQYSEDAGKTWKHVPIKVGDTTLSFETADAVLKFDCNGNATHPTTLMVLRYISDQDLDGVTTLLETKASTIAISEDEGKTWEVVDSGSIWSDALVFEGPGHDATVIGLRQQAKPGEIGKTQGMPFFTADERTAYAFMVMSKEKKFDSINEYEEFDFGPRSLGTYKKTGHVIVGFKDGGVVVGTLNPTLKKLEGAVEARYGASDDPAKTPWPTQSLLPSDDNARGLDRLVSFAPDFEKSNTLYASNHFSILMSRDGGKPGTWKPVLKMAHTRTSGHPKELGDCAVSRNTNRADPDDVFHESKKGAGSMEADYMYCVECKKGHARNPETATCSKDSELEEKVRKSVTENDGLDFIKHVDAQRGNSRSRMWTALSDLDHGNTKSVALHEMRSTASHLGMSLVELYDGMIKRLSSKLQQRRRPDQTKEKVATSATLQHADRSPAMSMLVQVGEDEERAGSPASMSKGVEQFFLVVVGAALGVAAYAGYARRIRLRLQYQSV